MTNFWPWWLGASVLGALTLGFWWASRVPLGISGFWKGAIDGYQDRSLNAAAAETLGDAAALEAAMLAATRAEFGDDATPADDSPAAVAPINDLRAPGPWSAHLAFLIALVIGGSVAAIGNGSWHWQWDLGATYARVFGDGWHIWPLLWMGGLAAGIGVCMAGGCPSGHGLSGVSRLQPGSLIATPVFFGTAVLVTALLETLR